MPLVVCKCQTCGEPFLFYNSPSSTSRGNYCSQTCRHETPRTRYYCGECGVYANNPTDRYTDPHGTIRHNHGCGNQLRILKRNLAVTKIIEVNL